MNVKSLKLTFYSKINRNNKSLKAIHLEVFMGCSFSEMSSSYIENGLIDKNHFVSTGILGEGGFGRVVAAMFVKTGTWYAVKEINKVSPSRLLLSSLF